MVTLFAAVFLGAAVLVAAFLVTVVFFSGFEAGAEGTATVVGLRVRFGRDDAAVRSMVFLGAMIVRDAFRSRLRQHVNGFRVR